MGPHIEMQWTLVAMPTANMDRKIAKDTVNTPREKGSERVSRRREHVYTATQRTPKRRSCAVTRSRSDNEAFSARIERGRRTIGLNQPRHLELDAGGER